METVLVKKIKARRDGFIRVEGAENGGVRLFCQDSWGRQVSIDFNAEGAGELRAAIEHFANDSAGGPEACSPAPQS